MERWGPRREAEVALGASVVVAAAMTWPTLEHPATTVPGDLGDPLLEAWTLGWDGHALLHQPLHPFDTNTFFPLKGSLGFTDSLLGLAPVSWIGHGPTAALVRYNLLYVAAFALCGWGTYLLARQLGSRPLGAAVAGAVLAYAPWRASQAGHLQILMCGALPLALALLARGHGLRVGDRDRPDLTQVDLRLVGAGWAVAAWQLTIGFGVGLQWAYTVAVLSLVSIGWWWRHGRVPLPRRLVATDLGGAALFLIVGGLMALPSLSALHDHPEARRTLGDLRTYSPTLRGLFTSPSAGWLLGGAESGARSGVGNQAETVMSIGAAATVLAIVGLVWGAAGRRRRSALAGGVLVLIVLALGTHGPWGGRLTYLVLFHHAPGFTGIRTPGRLVVTLMIPLALLAALGADAITTRLRSSPFAGLALVALVLLEGFSTIAHPRPPAPPTAALHAGAVPALVIPSDEPTDEVTMWWTTDDYEPVANGTSGFVPAETRRIRLASELLPTPAGFAGLRRAGIQRVIALLPRYTADQQRLLLGPLPAGVTRIRVGDDAVFFVGTDAP